MSRIGKKEITIPDDVEVLLNKSEIVVKGKKGQLEYNISKLIEVNKIENKLKLSQLHKNKKSQEIYGLSRSIISNMIIGVSTGFQKKLIIQGVGYRSQIEGTTLILNVGYSHPVYIEPPENIEIKVENTTTILISGINKEIVGQIASKIRSIKPPEPYKGKGIRYDKENIRRKVGKAGK